MSGVGRPTRAPDDVRFARCIRCGAPSAQGLCQPCAGFDTVLHRLGREPCAREDCERPRVCGTDYCKEHK